MNITARERLAKIVKEIRGTQSQRGFAKQLGVTGTAVKSWEDMESVPSTKNLKHIALLAGFDSVDGLLSYLNGKPSDKPTDLQELINRMYQLPIDQVAALTNAGMKRLTEEVTN